MMRKNVIWTLFLILYSILIGSISLPNTTWAGLYDNCIYSYEFTNRSDNTLRVKAVGSICDERCNNECKSFSRFDNHNNELNQDIIAKCESVCRNGTIFSSKLREPSIDFSNYGTKTYVWSDSEYKTKTFCSNNPNAIDSALYVIYPSGINVSAREKLRIELAQPVGFEGNVVYLCGQNSVYLDPQESPRPSSTTRGSSSGSPFIDPTAPASSNKNVQTLNPELANSWEARNPSFFNTGLDVKDRDFLSIQYTGIYKPDCGDDDCLDCWGKVICECQVGLQCARDNIAANFDLMIRDPSASRAAWNAANSLILPGNSLQLSPTYSDVRDEPYDFTEIERNNRRFTWYGLVPRISNIYEPHYRDKKNNITFSGYLGIPVTTNKIGIANHDLANESAEGAQSFSERHTRLGIRHFDKESNFQSWNNNYGGFFGRIDWKGCTYYGGQRLQYTFLFRDAEEKLIINIDEIEWKDIDQEQIKDGIELEVPAEIENGEIAFRVKPLSVEDFDEFKPNCLPSDTICQQSIQDIENRYSAHSAYGQYYLSVIKDQEESEIVKAVTDVVRTVRTYFFGNGDDTEGIVKEIFINLITDNVLLTAIRALLIFYIAFTGLSFVMGISPITQREGVIRLLKLGVVLMLISDQSWNFFYDYLFVLLVDGMTELIALVSSPAFVNDSIRNQIIQDPANVFLVYDLPLQQMFSDATWLKIWALVTSGFLGLLLGLAMIFAVFISMLVLLRALIIYLLSLIVMAILIILAPIFITMILFKYTYQMFDLWIKQLIVYILQPLFVFASISLLLHILIMAFQVALGYTVCEVCLFGFYWFDEGYICWLKGWTTLFGAHMPEGAVSQPLAQVAPVLFFLLIAQAMYVFASFASGLAILIGSGQFVGFDLGNVAEGFKTVGLVTEDIAGIIGMDYRSRSQRRKVRKDNRKKADRKRRRKERKKRNK